ncbi:Ribosomal lysine N-methyltransferase 4 [Diatrype stigma]|uniref:Ribosomal lysine N-methyltransferase 4 n=1 Tax=Diatrype stigma TaxID=117547 RepID=A0AAN9UQR9_9PEZI
MSPSTFEDQSQSFLDWFRAWPGTTFHESIKIQDLRERGAGRGIVATADIPEDTVLFTIPRKAIISVESSELSQKIPEVFEDSTTALEDADNEADEEGGESSVTPDSWVSLILVMIYEYLQGDRSAWKPYLNVLPKEFNTLMFWSEGELAELQASAITSKIGRDEAENMFRAKILPVIQAHATVFYPEGAERLGEEQLVTLCHCMGSTIMAYAFDLENDEEKPESEDDDEWIEDREGKIMMGMVPMADILNADAEFNAHVNHGEDALTVTSLRPISAGQEILNYYGPLANGELLRRYGYVTDKHSRYDVVEISWDLVLSVLKEALNFDEAAWGKVVREHTAPCQAQVSLNARTNSSQIGQLDPEEIEDTFVLDRDMDEPDSTGQCHDELKLSKLPEDLEGQISAFLKAVRKVSPETVPDKQRRNQMVLLVMKRAFELRASQYPTSYVQDFNLLSHEKVTGRQKMAVAVRWGEKVLLKEAIDFAQAKLDEIDSNVEQPEQRAAKKQRTK